MTLFHLSLFHNVCSTQNIDFRFNCTLYFLWLTSFFSRSLLSIQVIRSRLIAESSITKGKYVLHELYVLILNYYIRYVNQSISHSVCPLALSRILTITHYHLCDSIVYFLPFLPHLLLSLSHTHTNTLSLTHSLSLTPKLSLLFHQYESGSVNDYRWVRACWVSGQCRRPKCARGEEYYLQRISRWVNDKH